MQIKNQQIEQLTSFYGDYSYSLRKCFTQGYLIAKYGELIQKLLAAKCGVDVDVNFQVRNANRELLLELVKLIPGKWEKRTDLYNDGKLIYSLRVDDGVIEYNVEVSSDPPPSCKIIEVEEEVPARKIVRKRVVCGKNGDETGAVSTDADTDEAASVAGVSSEHSESSASAESEVA